MLEKWGKGYTKAELRAAENKFDLAFPPDLKALFLEKRPLGGHDWRNEGAIRKMLSWPLETLLFDVENNEMWWPEWGEKPASADSRKEVIQHVVSQAPRLLPLFSHRFLPEMPNEAGNPVFSVYGADTIYYGANLEDYFARELSPSSHLQLPSVSKRIPFWSELVERNE